jgi:RTX calcium-binding nonapeptide repeat (4 copies)
VSVSLTTGAGYGGDAEGDTLSSIENLYGSNYDDLLYGDAAANILDGSGGDDTILGYAGDDDLYGGSGRNGLYGGVGDDHLEGGPDADVLHGGSGMDFMRGNTGADDFVWSSTDDTGETGLPRISSQTSTLPKATGSTSAPSMLTFMLPATRHSASPAPPPSPVLPARSTRRRRTGSCCSAGTGTTDQAWGGFAPTVSQTSPCPSEPPRRQEATFTPVFVPKAVAAKQLKRRRAC